MTRSQQTMRIEISIKEQNLRLLNGSHLDMQVSVSTARNGPGERINSEQTPRGKHYIRAKIGAGLPKNAVLSGRRFTGEIYDATLGARFPDRDWILTRILWLCGQEIGKNRLGSVDSMRRFIYIHGTPDSEPMGEPRSHGCIRMRNDQIIELFERVPVGCPVVILE